MLTTLGPENRIWFCLRPTSLTRSFDGLSALVHNHLRSDPTNGDWYVFVNRRRTMMKILSFDRDGFWIWSKRLELGRFEELTGDGKKALTRTGLLALLEGVDVGRAAPVASATASARAAPRRTDGGALSRFLTLIDADPARTLPGASNGAPSAVSQYTVRIASTEAVSCRTPRPWLPCERRTRTSPPASVH